MTKKENYELKENTAKVLYKNSNNTLCTHSKTWSGASQFFTKSLVLELKQNFHRNGHYEDNGSTKRDLSIETDYCILRTHFKKKLTTNRDAISQKSKYSMNRTEMDTIRESKRDTSACGDSYQNFLENTNLNINLTSLVVANLKNLLNDWIKSYLLDKHDTKEKIESVLDSILHQLDLQRNDTPSSHTYTLDTETEQNQHHKSESFKAFGLQDFNVKRKIIKRKNKNSSLTIPLSGKHLKIISTLSLPRNMHNVKKTRDSLSKIRKFRHKRVLVSSNKSSVYVFNSSNLDFLILRTNSLVKHCATYKEDTFKNTKIYPKIKNSNIYKYIACLNILSDSKSKVFCKKKSPLQNNDNKLEETFNIKATSVSNENVQTVKPSSVESGKKQKKSYTCKNRISKYQYNRYFKPKKYTCLLKKSNNNKPIQQEKEIMQHFQSIFRYFSSFKDSNNFKLDIKVNIYPSQEEKSDNTMAPQKKDTVKVDNETKNTDTILVTQDVSHKGSSEDAESTFNCSKNIIPLLDGAASATRYMTIARETVPNINNIQNTENTLLQNDILKDSKVARDISELKTIVQSLATVTENLLTKHIEKKTETKTDIIIKEEKISKSVQFSNKSQLISGLKLRKEPRHKTTREYNPRLIKKTPSYNIINSESVLKVTDMTSTAEYTTATAIDEALTCSLPKSKSLFEVSVGSEKKLLAFYCDDYIHHYSGYTRQGNASYISIPCRNTYHHVRPSYILKYSEEDINATFTNRSLEPDIHCELCDDADDCSSVTIDIEKSCEREFVKGNRRFGFLRGFLLGALLWIPLTIILWVLYFYVIKDLIYPNQYHTIPKFKTSNIHFPTQFAPRFRATFNDLGF